jgi:MFS family permease
MISAFVHDPHYIGKHRTGSIDLWGIGFLALGFGMLQVVLDTGQRKDWFGSTQIRVFTFLCVFGLVALVIRELTTMGRDVVPRIKRHHPAYVRMARQPYRPPQHGFTITSVLCGMATTLEWLIFLRVLQGLTGGGLQPLAQAVLLETFPPKTQSSICASSRTARSRPVSAS